MTIIRDKKAELVLDDKQLKLKPLLQEFSSSHILVGGTAIALQLGHMNEIGSKNQ